MQTLLSVTKAAHELGLNKSTVSRQVAAGIIPNRGTARKPMIDVEEARQARTANLDHGKAKGRRDAGEDAEGEGLFAAPAAGEGEGPAAQKLTLNRARTAREGYLARQAQLDLEERLGALLDRREVEGALAEMATALRMGLAQRSRRLAEQLVGQTDMNAIQAAIDAEDRKLLERMSDDFAKRFAAT